jgi:hypothetical protein
LGKIKENPSAILLPAGEILLKQLDRYGRSVVVPELGLRLLPLRKFREPIEALRASSELP